MTTKERFYTISYKTATESETLYNRVFSNEKEAEKWLKAEVLELKSFRITRIYKKKHKSRAALNDHISKIKERGMIYRVKRMTIEYGKMKKYKGEDKSVTSTDSSIDLIKESLDKGYEKVKVVFFKEKLSDFPKDLRRLRWVKERVRTQKIEIFDALIEAGAVIDMLKRKDLKKDIKSINFV